MANVTQQDRHIAAAKTRLAHLGGLAAKAHAAEQRILEAAESRLSDVEADIAKIRPRAIADQQAGDEYQALTLERGQLATVIAAARQAIGQ